MGGSKAKQGFLTYARRVSPELRPLRAGAEVLAGPCGALGVPYGTVAAGFLSAPSGLETVQPDPVSLREAGAGVRFGLVEGSMASSAASAAGSSRGVCSRATWACGWAELVGGAVNPAKLVRGAGEYTWNCPQRHAIAVPEGRTTASAKLLADIARQDRRGSGHDLQGLKAVGVPGLENLTPARKPAPWRSGRWRTTCRVLGQVRQESGPGIQGLDVLRGHIALLAHRRPEALKTAAQVRDIYSAP